MAPLPGRRPQLLLELDLSARPAEPGDGDPIARIRARGRRLLRPTLRALHEAGSDRRVVGLVARIGAALPWASMQELRLAVRAFASSGKPTAAWAESFPEGADMAGYVLATAFDEIWLQPGGSLGLLGVGIETTFVRGALDRLGVEPQLEQRAEYKNAADRVLRTGFTPEHRESVEQLSQSIFTEAVSTIAAGRRLAPETVRQLIDTGPRTAEEAQRAGLVDRLGYRDQVLSTLRGRLPDDTELLFADRWHPRRALRLPARRRDHVALVEARGVIMSGRSRRGPGGPQLGADTVCAELRAAVDDDRAGAIVLHI